MWMVGKGMRYRSTTLISCSRIKLSVFFFLFLFFLFFYEQKMDRSNMSWCFSTEHDYSGTLLAVLELAELSAFI